ncbi:MAG TPA: VOC family protein [Hyphomicrobiaceae bacterium]|nr:VOC family protein [Hyphomicrobiaceae bacterium]
MEARISIVTLGVADVAQARSFYERLGFRAAGASTAEVAFLDAGGTVLALFGRDDLAADAGIAGSPGSGFSGVALAHNVRSEAEVDAVLSEAVAHGGVLCKAGERAHWGGYRGYFADPDGHLWEICYNPFFSLDKEGRIVLP